MRIDVEQPTSVAERALTQQGGEFLRRGTKPVLQHDAERDARGSARIDQVDRARGRDLQRLFEQNVLAGCRRAPDEVEVRIRRREDGDAVDAAVRQDAVEVIAQRKREPLPERRAPRLARAVGRRDLDAVGEVEQAFGMRRHRHAEADQRQAMSRHR